MSIRNSYWNGGAWVEITDTEAAIAANFIQQLLLILGESPCDSETGIPQQELIKSQGIALLYIYKVRDRFVQYFSDIIVTQTDENDYSIVVISNSGKTYQALITA